MEGPRDAPARRGLLLALRFPEWSRGKLTVVLLPALHAALVGALPRAQLGALVLCLAALGAWGYVLNDWCDREVDAAAAKPNSFAQLDRWRSAALLATPLAVAVSGALALDRAPLRDAALASTGLFAWAYSSPPVRLKGRGAAGLAAAILAQYALPLLVVSASVGDLTRPLLLAAGLLVLLGGATLEVGHQIADRANDRAAGVATYAVRDPESLTWIYPTMLRTLAVATLFLGVVSSAVLLLHSAPAARAVVAVGLGGITLQLVRAVARQSHATPFGSYDPFYASKGNALDRLYTYYPNAVLPVCLATLCGDLWIVVGTLAWVGCGWTGHGWQWHAKEWYALLSPPETRG